MNQGSSLVTQNTTLNWSLCAKNGIQQIFLILGDAPRKFWIKPLKETDLGVAQAFFDPLKETMLKHRQLYLFPRAALNETFMAKFWYRFAQNTLSETKIRNLHP